jgi:hypothetical protein
MIRRAVKIITIAIGLMSSAAQAGPPIHFNGTLPAKDCTASTNFCEVTVPIGNLTIVDGDGNVAAQLSRFVFNIIQFPSPDGPLLTNWIANYDQYNKTQRGPTGGAFQEGLYIRFLDSSGNYLSDMVSISVTREACRDLGHMAQIGQLGDVFSKGAATFEITQEVINGDIAPC